MALLRDDAVHIHVLHTYVSNLNSMYYYRKTGPRIKCGKRANKLALSFVSETHKKKVSVSQCLTKLCAEIQ